MFFFLISVSSKGPPGPPGPPGPKVMFFLVPSLILWRLVFLTVNENLNGNFSFQGNMGLNFQGPKGEKVSKEKVVYLVFMFLHSYSFVLPFFLALFLTMDIVYLHFYL